MKTLLDLPRLDADPASPFPPTSDALQSPNGLLAWGGDLQPQRLLSAYRQGIFPWYTEGQPILWWNPAPRCIIFPGDVYISRRTARRHNCGSLRLTADRAFGEVVRKCAEPRDYDSGTWITKEMLEAYVDLHHLGHAHSIEVWDGSTLVGGIYGLAIGQAFFGESMFSRTTDASKIALISLCRELSNRSFGFLDCQVRNPHLMSMGAIEVSREHFSALLAKHAGANSVPGMWTDSFCPENRWL